MKRNATQGLVKLINDFELPESSRTNLLPENFQLGVLFRENQDMRERLYDSKNQIEALRYALEGKQEYIKVIEAEKKRALEELEEKINELKSEFLNYMMTSALKRQR